MVTAFAVALALLCFSVLTQTLAHTHAKGENEAACQVCQAAHLGSAPTTLAELLSSPVLAARNTFCRLRQPSTKSLSSMMVEAEFDRLDKTKSGELDVTERMQSKLRVSPLLSVGK